MDDDLTFGASVWAATETQTSPSSASELENGQADFDDFDGFAAPKEESDTVDADDDFGDFGDFGEVGTGTAIGFGEAGFEDVLRIPGPSHNWRPLQLDPFPSRQSLEREINETLAPVWNNENINDVTTDDPIREVEGASQILLTQGSREMYRLLLQTPPPTKPPNWTRSRIRRQHLIALGIPVNLDEVLPRSTGKPLPPLEIYTRPNSAPPDSRNQHRSAGSSGNLSRASSRSRASKAGQSASHAHLGDKPILDTSKINKLLAQAEESLTMQPLASLERHLADLKTQTANTSNLLTYLLQTRDDYSRIQKTYNGLIAEMVGQAQSLQSGKTRTGSIRRGSGM